MKKIIWIATIMLLCAISVSVGQVTVHEGKEHDVVWNRPTEYMDGTPLPPEEPLMYEIGYQKPGEDPFYYPFTDGYIQHIVLPGEGDYIVVARCIRTSDGVTILSTSRWIYSNVEGDVPSPFSLRWYRTPNPGGMELDVL